MAKLVMLKCPRCGADISIKEGTKQGFCTYCGAKLYLDTNNEYIIRHVDEADVKRAETERIIRMEQINAEDEEREEKKARRKKRIAVKKWLLITFLIAGILLLGGSLLVYDLGIAKDVAGWAMLGIWMLFMTPFIGYSLYNELK